MEDNCVMNASDTVMIFVEFPNQLLMKRRVVSLGRPVMIVKGHSPFGLFADCTSGIISCKKL